MKLFQYSVSFFAQFEKENKNNKKDIYILYRKILKLEKKLQK